MDQSKPEPSVAGWRICGGVDRGVFFKKFVPLRGRLPLGCPPPFIRLCSFVPMVCLCSGARSCNRCWRVWGFWSVFFAGAGGVCWSSVTPLRQLVLWGVSHLGLFCVFSGEEIFGHGISICLKWRYIPACELGVRPWNKIQSVSASAGGGSGHLVLRVF